MFLGSLVLLGSLGFLGWVSGPWFPGPWGSLGPFVVSRLGGPTNEMSGSGRTVLNVRLRAHGA